MLKVQFLSGLTGELTEVIVSKDGNIAGDTDFSIDGFYTEDNSFLLIETVELAVGMNSFPDTWQQLYIGLPDGDVGEAVVSLEYVPSAEEVLEGIIRELNNAANDDVATEFLKSLGRSHNDSLKALGLPVLGREIVSYSIESLESMSRTDLLNLLKEHGYEDGYQYLSNDELIEILDRVGE